ncbi:MAG: ATP-grasp domain-containing protein [Deltaproteobacteria bacterium]|nr:ATP-grasp domain-containing protein [Deltaproteobacteria bacterium]
MKKILVANRGEIAIRILRTAREMGFKTVAVYSEEDQNALHRFEADESICIGPAESQKSYLKVENILDAAKKTKADAIHPGYGFLSENSSFAAEVKIAGLTFIGPAADVIKQMGDKVLARQAVEKAGVPTVPGTGALKSVEEALTAVKNLLKTRKDFKFPLLVKAAGGGGGKGMRIVRSEGELKENIERARSEALKAFNNETVFVERYLEEPRHIEVQVLGDGKSVLHLFERECSLQRRHQKVVEEAQSPSLTPQLREKILAAGVAAAKAVKYSSAGTVEFIVSNTDDFYFLEMNTRIQVEHPVSEWITGIDLIRWQIDIANGKPLKLSQEDIRSQGHSIEVRLYAEDCDHGFLPQPGKLHFLRFPHWTGVRVDSAVISPTTISSFYDPMIAKISAWAPTREECRQRMKLFLEKTEVEGLITNKAFLLEILNAEFFKKGHYHTQLLESPNWRKKIQPSNEILAALCLKDYLENKISFESRNLSSWQQESYALAP